MWVFFVDVLGFFLRFLYFSLNILGQCLERIKSPVEKTKLTVIYLHWRRNSQPLLLTLLSNSLPSPALNKRSSVDLKKKKSKKNPSTKLVCSRRTHQHWANPSCIIHISGWARRDLSAAGPGWEMAGEGHINTQIHIFFLACILWVYQQNLEILQVGKMLHGVCNFLCVSASLKALLSFTCENFLVCFKIGVF